MLRITLMITLVITCTRGVDVSFTDGPECTGDKLFGGSNMSIMSCYDISDFVVPTSIDVSGFHPGQAIQFYFDPACKHPAFRASGEQCYSPGSGSISAYSVHTTAHYEKYYGPKELVPYGLKLSHERDVGLKRRAVNSTDAGLSTFILGASAIGLSSAITFAGAVYGCYSILQDADPPTIVFCILTPVAVILAHVGHILFRRGAIAVQNDIELGTGHIYQHNHYNTGNKDRINARNFEFLSTLMNVTESPMAHVGYMMRDMGYGNQTSPVYKLDLGHQDLYHFTAFLNEDTGSYIHHMHTADRQLEQKRSMPKYNSIRWTANGLDFDFCAFHAGASPDGFHGTVEHLYDIAYKDMKCLVGAKDIRTKNLLLVDLHNSHGLIVGAVTIAPYKDGGPVQVSRIDRCTTREAHEDANCNN